jgi:hypothetical protein
MAAPEYPINDPLEVAGILWPDVHFYDKQVEIIESVRCNDETFVPAGNELGKDFVAGFIALGAFLAPNVFLRNPKDCWLDSAEVRIITTSVRDDHLRVLWGEIGRFIQDSVEPLRIEDGGDLWVNHHDIRKVNEDGERDQISYLRGMVSAKGEGMAGHHAPHTLLIIDEASGVDNVVFTQGDTWSKRKLIIGNPNPTINFFFDGVKGGDLLAKGV